MQTRERDWLEQNEVSTDTKYKLFYSVLLYKAIVLFSITKLKDSYTFDFNFFVWRLRFLILFYEIEVIHFVQHYPSTKVIVGENCLY